MGELLCESYNACEMSSALNCLIFYRSCENHYGDRPNYQKRNFGWDYKEPDDSFSKEPSVCLTYRIF